MSEFAVSLSGSRSADAFLHRRGSRAAVREHFVRLLAVANASNCVRAVDAAEVHIANARTEAPTKATAEAPTEARTFEALSLSEEFALLRQILIGVVEGPATRRRQRQRAKRQKPGDAGRSLCRTKFASQCLFENSGKRDHGALECGDW